MEVTYIVHIKGVHRAFGTVKCVLFSEVSLFHGMLNKGFLKCAIHSDIWDEVQLHV